MADTVDLSDVIKLRSLFKRKEWLQMANEDAVFNNFCLLLNNLNLEQKQLIHELAEHYLWIPSSQYETKFNDVLNLAFDNALKGCQKIYLIPIVKKSDRKKIKSSDHCIYLLKGILSLNQNFRKIQYEILDDFDRIVQLQVKNDGSEVNILVDDFIGTGDTLENCWIDICQNNFINKNNTIIVSLVIQSDGLDFISSKLGLSVYYSQLRVKGISDNYSSPHKEEKIRIMRDIETIIKPGQFAFGYKGSEALVTMVRTPNNTFPVFWKKYKIRKQEFDPPFVRF